MEAMHQVSGHEASLSGPSRTDWIAVRNDRCILTQGSRGGKQRFGGSQHLFWGRWTDDESWTGSTVSGGPC